MPDPSPIRVVVSCASPDEKAAVGTAAVAWLRELRARTPAAILGDAVPGASFLHAAGPVFACTDAGAAVDDAAAATKATRVGLLCHVTDTAAFALRVARAHDAAALRAGFALEAPYGSGTTADGSSATATATKLLRADACHFAVDLLEELVAACRKQSPSSPLAPPADVEIEVVLLHDFTTAEAVAYHHDETRPAATPERPVTVTESSAVSLFTRAIVRRDDTAANAALGRVGVLRTPGWLYVDQHSVRAYAGADSALYFAWMNHYSQWLLLPALFGVCVFVLRVYFDTTVLHPWFAGGMCVWAMAFIKSWERKQSLLALRYGLVGDGITPDAADVGGIGLPGWGSEATARCGGDEPGAVRDAFYGDVRVSPVTGEKETVYPAWKRCLYKYTLTAAVVAAYVGLCGFFQLLSLNLQGYMHNPIAQHMRWRRLAALAEPGAVFDPNSTAALIPVVLHVVLVMVLGGVFKSIATWLCDNENHRTNADWHRHYVLKRVAFEAIDCFAVFFFVAFYLCDIQQLRQEFTSVFSVDQVRRLALETLVPFLLERRTRLQRKLQQAVRRRKAKLQKKLQSSHEDTTQTTTSPTVQSPLLGSDAPEKQAQQAVLDEAASQIVREPYDSFDDYLEMVMQFAYVALFASAFPLAAALSLVGNMIEVRSDLFKFCFVHRRPQPRRLATIGPWIAVLRVIAVAAAMTNCLLIGFTSRRQLHYYFPGLFDGASGGVAHDKGRYVVAIVVALEHALLLLAFVVHKGVDSVPGVVRDHVARLLYVRNTKPATHSKAE